MSEEEEKPDLMPLALTPDMLLDERIISIYGTIDEMLAGPVCHRLMQIHLEEKEIALLKEGSKAEPVHVIVSTHGGVAVELFSIYDMIRMVRESVPVSTLGLGKIMSSGLLLLAAGTKGKRRIGKSARLMFHDVIAESSGHIHEMMNSMKEADTIQKYFMQTIINETNLTQKDIKKLLSRKSDFYFSAEEALEFGFVDSIV